MLISSSIPNLVNGVSQQPDTLRLASQAEAQDNFLSSVVEGLKRRPSTRHLARLSNTSWASAYTHTINRDITERYILAIMDGDLLVYDIMNDEMKTVNFPDGKGYLAATATADFRAVTVADYTFIVNRSKTVAMSSETTGQRANRVLIPISGGNYSKTFSILIDGAEKASFTTPDGSSSEDVEKIATDYIANELATQLTANLGVGWSVILFTDVIVVKKDDDSTFGVIVSDGFNNAYMKAIDRSVQRFSDLPNHAPVGYRVEVAGDASSNFDNYYVKWAAEEYGYSTGVWEETVKWGIPFKYDASTMPHILVREADGTFTFKEAEWGERTVGDEDSAPQASFVGRTLNDVFFFKNRLGFAADENIVMSRSGDYFNFWPQTVTTVVDSDPIDIGVSNVKVSTIQHAVPFNQTLLLFSDQTQFVLSGGDILSPSTVSVSTTTEFEGDSSVRPVGAGASVYFPVTRGSYSGLREYFVEADTQVNNASDVTSHCPKYVPGNISSLEASSNEDMLVALSGEEPNKLFVYKYFYGQEGKLQSSWSRWVFGEADNILNISFVQNRMYVIVERDGDGVFLEQIDLESGAADENSDILYRVDRKVYERDCLSVTYDNGYTDFELPFNEEGDLWVFVRAGDEQYPEGYVRNYIRPGPANIVRLEGDWTGNKICIGRRYTSSYSFSTFLIKEQAVGGGQSSIASGRLQILHMALDYDNAGYFEVHVTPTGRDTSKYIFTGRLLGSVHNRTNAFGLETGNFKYPVFARNRDVDIVITSDHFLPCSFMSAEWEARYNTRTRRL